MNSLKCLTPECITLLQKHQLLQPLLKAELIATKLAGVQVSLEEDQSLIEDFKRQNSLQIEEELEAWLQANNLKRERLLEQLEQPLRLNKYCKENFSLKAEARFLERKLHLDQVVYSLLRLKDPFQARELYLRIAEGEADFGSLSAEFSDGREKQTRGIVGPVPLMQAHPQLVNVLKSSKPGELREPIQIEGWNLIVRMESYQAATLDFAMERRMAQELFGQWIDEEVQRMIEHLNSETSSQEAQRSTSPTP